MTKVIRYQTARKEGWNDFVSSQRLPFLFYREYMDYHADRFTDYSLMFVEENTILAILPANRNGKQLISHQGLTFGGIYCKDNYKTKDFNLLEIFAQYLLKTGVTELIYKQNPAFIKNSSVINAKSIFLKKSKTNLLSREINLAIPTVSKAKIQQRRKRGYKKANIASLTFCKSEQWETYWQLLESNLMERFRCKPVHSIQEILLLKNTFPKNIRLFTSLKDDQILAGAVIYFYNDQVAHCQYLSVSKKGKSMGALDFLIFELQKYLKHKYLLSLGVSTLREKGQINKGLYEWKAGFGAKSYFHDTYKLDLKAFNSIEQKSQSTASVLPI